MTSISVTPKKRGRPATGKNPHVSVRMEPELIAAVDEFRAATEAVVSQSEAIRTLVADALKEKGYLPK